MKHIQGKIYLKLYAHASYWHKREITYQQIYSIYFVQLPPSARIQTIDREKNADTMQLLENMFTKLVRCEVDSFINIKYKFSLVTHYLFQPTMFRKIDNIYIEDAMFTYFYLCVDVYINTDEIDVSWYEIDVSWYEIDVSWYEIDVSWYEIDVSWYEIDVSWYEIDVSWYEIDVSWYEIDVSWYEIDVSWYEIDVSWYEIDVSWYEIDVPWYEIDVSWYEIDVSWYEIDVSWYEIDVSWYEIYVFCNWYLKNLKRESIQ